MITYRTAGAWGAGIGMNLTPAQVDGNFYDHEVRIEALETYPTAAVYPTSVSAVGSQITFAYSDASSFTVTVPSATTPVPAPVSTQSGATYTVVIGDANDYIRLTNAGGCIVTIPLNASVAFPVGTEIHFRQSGAGEMQFLAEIGVTINKPDDMELSTDVRGSVVTIKKVAADEWDLFGDLTLTASVSA